MRIIKQTGAVGRRLPWAMSADALVSVEVEVFPESDGPKYCLTLNALGSCNYRYFRPGMTEAQAIALCDLVIDWWSDEQGWQELDLSEVDRQVDPKFKATT